MATLEPYIHVLASVFSEKGCGIIIESFLLRFGQVQNCLNFAKEKIKNGLLITNEEKSCLQLSGARYSTLCSIQKCVALYSLKIMTICLTKFRKFCTLSGTLTGTHVFFIAT